MDSDRLLVASIDEPQRAPSSVRRLLRVLGALGMLVALAFLVYQLREHAGALRPFELTGRSRVRIGAAFVACFLVLATALINWRLLLGRAVAPSYGRLAVVLAYAQVAKYLPGNVFQYAYGVAIGTRVGIPALSMTTTLAGDVAVSLVAGLFFGLSGLAATGQLELVLSVLRPTLSGTIWLVLPLAAVVLGGLVLLLRKSPLLSRIRTALRSFSVGTLGWVFLLNGVQFCLYGLCASQLAHLWVAGTGASFPSPFVMASGFALAWVAGMAVPGPPGGLGIREAILYALFAPVMGQPVAAATFLSMRVVLTATEVLVFLPAPFLLRRYERAEVAGAP